MKIRNREESMAARTFRRMACEAFMESGISARGPNDMRISRCLHDGKPIPDDLLPGRELERMKSRLSPDERESLKSLTSDLIQDRPFGC